MDPQLKYSLLDYFKYINGTENSRTVYEGEQVVNAGHVILCGVTEKHPDSLKLYALCLQTSALQSAPHIIEIMFDIQDEITCIVCNATCSCKAGRSGRCKHISAVLILCTRTSLDKLERVSQTDIACAWSAQKQEAQSKYKAVPFEEMPCFKNINNEETVVNKDVLRSICSNLMSALPFSAMALHRAGRKTEEASNSSTSELDVTSTSIINCACQSVLMMNLATLKVDFIAECCTDSYNNKFFDLPDNIIADTKVSKKQWFSQRQFRITGSRIYEIYTYKGQDWSKKSLDYFYPKCFTSKYVSHGLKQEGVARSAFEKNTGFIVLECGLVVSQFNPWLGYSPDGIIFDDKGSPKALLEIKCPFSGSTETVDKVLKKLKYLVFNNGVYCLKQHHMYYAQVQLDNSMVILEISYDYEYAKTLLFTVKEKFFKYMLHEICVRK